MCLFFFFFIQNEIFNVKIMYVNLQVKHYVFVHSILLSVMCTYIKIKTNKILYYIYSICYLYQSLLTYCGNYQGLSLL